MTHQNIVVLILVTAAVLLLIRQVYRMITGKTGGCFCASPPPKHPNDDTPDSPK